MAPEGVNDTLTRVLPNLSAATLEYQRAVAQRADRWVPACGGNEVPFTAEGSRWLYVFNPATAMHKYLNLDTDLIHDDYRRGTC